MQKPIDYSAVAQPASVKKYEKTMVKWIAVLSIGLLVPTMVISLIFATVTDKNAIFSNDDYNLLAGIVGTIIVFATVSGILFVLIRHSFHGSRKRHTPNRWELFTAANGFTYTVPPLGPIAGVPDDAGSVLLSMSGDLERTPTYPIGGMAPLSLLQYSIGGRWSDVAFFMGNFSLSPYGMNLTQSRLVVATRFYSVVRVTDKRLATVPDFIALPKNANPAHTMFNFRFTHLPEWYISPVGPEADIRYDTLTHYDPPVDLTDESLSGLLTDLFSLSQSWVECHDGALFIVKDSMLASDRSDLEPRFTAIELIADYLATLN